MKDVLLELGNILSVGLEFGLNSGQAQFDYDSRHGGPWLTQTRQN